MANENPSMLYISRKKSVENYVKRLALIGINTEEMIDSINKVDADLREEQNSLCFNNNSFLKYAERLEKLESEIIKGWGAIFELDKMASSLKIDLQNGEKINIQENINQIKSLLDSLINNPNFNYEGKEEVINVIYQVVYSFLKIEALFSKSSKLLDEIKNNPIHTTYISELIEKDIREHSKNGDLKLQKMQLAIESNGIGSKNLIDHDLLLHIALKTDSKYIEKRLAELNKILMDYEKITTKVEAAKEQVQKDENAYKERRARTNESLGRVITRLAIWGIELTILVGSTIGFYKLHKSGDKSYETTKTTYDAETQETTSEAVYEHKNRETGVDGGDYIIVEETGPWREGEDIFGETVYKRDITTRHIEKTEQELKEYLNDYTEISSKDETESVKEMPEDFNDPNIKYKVTDVSVGEDFIYTTGDLVKAWLWAIWLGIQVLRIELLISKNFMKDSLSDRVEDYKLENDLLKEHKTKLTSSTAELKELLKACKEISDSLEQYPIEAINLSKNIESVSKTEEQPKVLQQTM